MWATFLLYSSTRSSLVGHCALGEVAARLRAANAADAEETVAIAAPWRVACVAERESEAAAAAAKCSGFRARYKACASLASAVPAAGTEADASEAAGALERLAVGDACEAYAALDGMTYASVDVRHPDRDNWTTVRALVDTGSTDCEVKAEVIAALDLPDTGETATFETAIGRVAEQPIYRAVIRVLGREAAVLLSPAEGDDDSESESSDDDDDADAALDAQFGFDTVSDDALLGHAALAELGLAVDCRRRRLVVLDGD